ncbi:MAG: hypothetical protein KAZ30_02180 [Candidatus Magasanikbacteria bacterium]|nr:hypothetical protein [Candidatus Magasanikbacteria bacterium]
MSGQTKNEILTPSQEQLQKTESAPKQPDFLIEQEKNEKPTEVIKEEGFLDDAIQKLKNSLRASKKKPIVMPQVRDDLTLKIEHVMEDGLKDAFIALSPLEQQEFKLKGEQTARQIRSLLGETKIKIKKIFELLLQWLKLLPGVNQFFLEQEAKIKVDQILAIHKQNKDL